MSTTTSMTKTNWIAIVALVVAVGALVFAGVGSGDDNGRKDAIGAASTTTSTKPAPSAQMCATYNSYSGAKRADYVAKNSPVDFSKCPVPPTTTTGSAPAGTTTTQSVPAEGTLIYVEGPAVKPTKPAAGATAVSVAPCPSYARISSGGAQVIGNGASIGIAHMSYPSKTSIGGEWTAQMYMSRISTTATTVPAVKAYAICVSSGKATPTNPTSNPPAGDNDEDYDFDSLTAAF